MNFEANFTSDTTATESEPVGSFATIEQLYANGYFHNLAYYVGTYRGLDKEGIADLEQDLAVKALTHPDKLDADGWEYGKTVATNAVTDRYRRASCRPEGHIHAYAATLLNMGADGSAAEEFTTTFLPTTPDHADGVVDTMFVQDLTAGLRPAHKESVHLFYYDDKSHQQIAEELDIPVGTVKSRLSIASTNIRERLAEAGIINRADI